MWSSSAKSCLFVLLPFFAHAQATISSYEVEPNNTPAEANPIAGEVTVVGSMNGTDQDGFMWTVSDEDARKRWVFELQGIPGRLTIAQVFRIEFADNGSDVANKVALMKMGTRDGATPSITRDLVFEPGDYLIGIAYGGGSSKQPGGGLFRPPAAGLSFGDNGRPEVTADTPAAAAPEPGAYRFLIRHSSDLHLQPQPPQETREQARQMGPGSHFHTFETRDSAWYRVDFKPEDSGQRWDLSIQVPVGRTIDATLFDAAGKALDRRRNGDRGHLDFPDIVPGEEPYLLQLEPREPGFITAVESVKVGQRVAGEEAEPNGQWTLANRIDFTEPLRAASNEPGDADFFRFSIDAAGDDMLKVLRLASEPDGQYLRACLHSASGTELQCRTTNTPIEFPDLLLAPGDYGLSVTRGRAEFSYIVSLSEQGPVESGREVEPNDALEIASTVPANLRIKGRASGTDRDWYQFLIAEEPQLWRFQVIGENIREVAVLDGTGEVTRQLRPKAGEKRMRLDDLFLLPGRHYVRIDAEDGAEYALLARALGPPNPNAEREPNNDRSRMQRLAIGQTRTGLLSDADDTDFYRFFLAHWDHVKLVIEPPPDGSLTSNLDWYDHSLAESASSEPGETLSFAGVLPPGDYSLQLSPGQVSDAEYHLSLERLPRWSCASDCEPSGLNHYHGASPLPANLVLEGVSGDWRDMDSYQLPTLAEPGKLTIRSAAPVRRLFLGRQRLDSKPLVYDQETAAYEASVPADTPMRLIVESRGAPYRLALEFENGPQPPDEPGLPADMRLALDTATVAAFSVYGQVFGGELTLINTGTVPLTAQVEATTSDYRWQVKPGIDDVSLESGGRVSVPLEVRVPPDAWADHAVRISTRAFDAAGRQIETWVDVQVDREAPAVNPDWNWAIPDALRGGFNVAWIPFGSTMAGEVPRGAESPLLRDGAVIQGLRTNCCAQNGGWKDTRPSITLRLPGEEPAPVAGLALHNFGVPSPYQNLRRGTLMLSVDGVSYEDALSFETLPVLTEQYFALEEPVMARFARLRLEETYELRSGAGGVTFAEWKVILAPGHDISGGAGFDLARPEYGGHVVWDGPPQPVSPSAILDPERVPNPPRAPADQAVEYVIGFHDDRAAQVQRIEWTNPEGVRAEYAFEKVVVSVSTESPIGPWRTVGELDPDVSAETRTLQLDPPAWARFVRFTGVRQGRSGIAAAPQLISIWERPTGPDYRSILAEWGDISRRGWFEEQAGIPPASARTFANNRTRDKAAPLAANQSVTGEVQLARWSHWYRLTMPADANTLSLSVSGQPTVRTVLGLEDASGAPVAMTKRARDSTPYVHVFEAFADPASELFLHVYEPPRNVIFTWDTSASVNAHLPTIYNALSAFVGQVVPGQESANFVPFGNPLLLDSWLGEPYMLQTVLNDYPRKRSSSSGEHALKASAQALAPVAGTKSIVIITDGVVVHHGPMWKEMQAVQPRIFSIGVAGQEPANFDVFQDWSSVNGGQFTHLRYKGEMEVAFDRATTLMRRPAAYALQVQTEFREAPGPGYLHVTGGETSGTASGAVELILDASGSMLQRMAGKRRIVIARDVLTAAVREHIPAGTPVALRVFGHTQPGSCDTELLMPLGPLDPAAAAMVIGGVEARNLAKTPIAASLAAVQRDLGDTRAAAVILVTDGEETCDGDPEAVIRALAEQGVDVTLNIVGFAIDDPALEAEFADWAELGRGRYFSAEDETGLSQAIGDALQVPYVVFDLSGDQVADGRVGGAPVALQRGTYRVLVRTSPSQEFEAVEVRGEEKIELQLE